MEEERLYLIFITNDEVEVVLDIELDDEIQEENLWNRIQGDDILDNPNRLIFRTMLTRMIYDKNTYRCCYLSCLPIPQSTILNMERNEAIRFIKSQEHKFLFDVSTVMSFLQNKPKEIQE